MVDLAAIEAARTRLAGAVGETPCTLSPRLSELTGTRCFLKLENLQMTGSFKERGAANLLLQLDAAERARGVITARAGNHGLAVAYHAGRLGVAATIVMPEMLSRIIERGLVKDGRLVRLGVLLCDRPGELARLTALIAEARANVVHIEHDRAFARWAGIGETEVELTLEASGRDQIAELLTRLRAGSYRVEERRIHPAR